MSPGFAASVVYQISQHLFLTFFIVSTSNSYKTISDITADLSSEVADIESPTYASSPRIKNRKRAERNKGLRAM